MTAQMTEETIGLAGPEDRSDLARNDPAGLVLDSRVTPGQCGIVVVRGELDLITAHRLHTYVKGVIDRAGPVVALDMAEVTFCDASGLGALAKIANYADGAGCTVVLEEPTPQVAQVLRIGKLEDRFAMVPNPETLHPATNS